MSSFNRSGSAFIDGATVSLKSVQVRNNRVDTGSAPNLYWDGQLNPGVQKSCPQSGYNPITGARMLSSGVYSNSGNANLYRTGQCAQNLAKALPFTPTAVTPMNGDPKLCVANTGVTYGNEGSTRMERTYNQRRYISNAYIPVAVRYGPQTPYSTLIGGALAPSDYPYTGSQQAMYELGSQSDNISFVTQGNLSVI